MNRFGGLCAALCVAAALTACGGESGTAEPTETGTATATASPSAETTTAPADGPTITITGMAFGAPLTVGPGAQIAIRNDDSAEHSVTSRTVGAFDVHVDGGQQATLTAPTEPGEYAFYCIYHPSMAGTLIVA